MPDPSDRYTGAIAVLGSASFGFKRLMAGSSHLAMSPRIDAGYGRAVQLQCTRGYSLDVDHGGRRRR